MNRSLDVATSTLVSGLTAAQGYYVFFHARQPEKLLELYEFEACPFCRKVREALSAFDLDAKIYPCPPDGTRYRPEAIALGGQKQFPLLVDPNTNRRLYESEEIIRYLATTYGDGRLPFALRLGPLSTLRSVAGGIARPGRFRAKPSKAPNEPLELWSYEASPFCRIAREALSRLELPYILHNVAKKSHKREAFVAKSGKMMVPFLVDPNTGTAMFESADIVRYLERTYGA
ncbi:MAG TPA: glutathione S-transferase N-terminal domain-containing protein [Polyangiaceae bacterium]|nr:glutathione S-transferase N-terminal domain-containing protein [Polyangiaceae bacterium]